MKMRSCIGKKLLHFFPKSPPDGFPVFINHNNGAILSIPVSSLLIFANDPSLFPENPFWNQGISAYLSLVKLLKH
jgi:hypothetical protein